MRIIVINDDGDEIVNRYVRKMDFSMSFNKRYEEIKSRMTIRKYLKCEEISIQAVIMPENQENEG